MSEHIDQIDKSNVTVVYHDRCLDGFAAAWVAHGVFGDAATYHGGIYGAAPPDVRGRDVFIVDFSYPRAVLLAMKDVARSLVVIDHHRTAMQDLDGLPFAIFDMNRSGCGLTWDELVVNRRGLAAARPWFIDYVEDRDLWRFALPHSKEVNAYLSTIKHEFPAWTALHDESLDRVVDKGSAVLAFIDRYVQEMGEQAITRRFCGHDVPVVNTPYINTSEVVGALAERAPFAMGWFQRFDGKYAYSLRSRGDFDVSLIAKRFGGGGHRNAAGFSTTEPVHATTPE